MENTHLSRQKNSALFLIDSAIEQLVLEIEQLEDQLSDKDAEIEKLQNKVSELYEEINGMDN